MGMTRTDSGCRAGVVVSLPGFYKPHVSDGWDEVPNGADMHVGPLPGEGRAQRATTSLATKRWYRCLQ